MSVGSVCVLGEPWLDLLADCVQLLLLLLLLMAKLDNDFFSGAFVLFPK